MNNSGCTLCGDDKDDVILVSSPKSPEKPICISCFLMWQRINRNGFDLLSIVNQLDILAEDILGDNIDPESLRNWAIQLRDIAAPILTDIYGAETPVPEPTPEPPEGVDPLLYYLDMMRQDGY